MGGPLLTTRVLPDCVGHIYKLPFRYRFMMVDVGCSGRSSDGGIFGNSPIGRHMEQGTAHLPQPAPVAEGGIVLPHVLVGDEAFALKPYMLRPYPG